MKGGNFHPNATALEFAFHKVKQHKIPPCLHYVVLNKGGRALEWIGRLCLAYIAGTVHQELLLRNRYLAGQNRILRAQIKGRLCPSQGEKATLTEIANRLGRKALAEVAVRR